MELESTQFSSQEKMLHYITHLKFCKQSTQYPDIVTSSVPDWMSYDIELLQIGGVGENRTPNRMNVKHALFRVEITTP